jgi:hypothetical protein
MQPPFSFVLQPHDLYITTPLFGYPFPTDSEHDQQFGRQHDIAIFMAFALVNPNDHALAIDRSWLEADSFGDPQTSRVTDGQKDAVLKIVHRPQEARNFVLAQNNGKLFRLTAGGNIVFDSPWPLEGNGVEKPEGRDRDNDRTGCEMSLLCQVEQVGPDLGRAKMFGRSAKRPAKPNDLLDIRTLRMPRQVADLHILDQPTTKRAHGQLLCEMDSATWRPHIVSQLSCQARTRGRTTATNGSSDSQKM